VLQTFRYSASQVYRHLFANPFPLSFNLGEEMVENETMNMDAQVQNTIVLQEVNNRTDYQGCVMLAPSYGSLSHQSCSVLSNIEVSCVNYSSVETIAQRRRINFAVSRVCMLTHSMLTQLETQLHCRDLVCSTSKQSWMRPRWDHQGPSVPSLLSLL
jgi:hypothetical protein